MVVSHVCTDEIIHFVQNMRARQLASNQRPKRAKAQA